MPTPLTTWAMLLCSLGDWNGEFSQPLLGVDIGEWLALVKHDWDEVDAIYLDAETIGA